MQQIYRRGARHRTPWTAEADAELTEKFGSGLTLKEVALKLERTQEAVRSRANILGVPVRSAPRLVPTTDAGAEG
ncbi:hypothetical protein ABC347_16320 [Sphingomonas sp. 1P06PA]|uniref:hypothetical protein n=1 Tax=Sphingomonas sp. 1P06PA TaxID=554121 RepID=UPI0039A68D5C